MYNILKQSTGRASLTKIKGLILAALIFGVMALPSSVFAQTNQPPPGATEIDNLSTTVLNLGLQNGTQQSLLAKLDAALNSVLNGNLNAACGQLDAFINEVNAQAGKKITTAQATQLIDVANYIKTVLGCT